jgi:hypothetical protein
VRSSLLALALVSCATPDSPPADAQDEADEGGLLASLLADRPDRFGAFLADPAAHRLQILVAEVVDGHAGQPVLRRHSFRADAEYFYPASSIKTCAAVAALQELERHLFELDLDTPLVYHPLFDDEELETGDDTNLSSGEITVGHEIRKLAIVSDNRAFNRLYELVGHEALNQRMWAAGLTSVSIIHRLSEARSYEDNLRTPAVDLGLGGAALRLPERESRVLLDNTGVPRLLVGERHVAGEAIVDSPMDFTRKNRITLRDLQDMLCLVVRPDVDLDLAGFDLAEEHRAFLAEAMRQTPGESENPRWDAEEYAAERYKLLLPGLERVLPRERLDVYSKIGVASGFTTENDYVVDRETGRCFFVAAPLYTNPNGVVNDGDYAYDELAAPFFADLGEVLARRFLLAD